MLRSLSVARLAAQAASHDAAAAAASTTTTTTLNRLPLRSCAIFSSHPAPAASSVVPQCRTYATRGRPKAGKATTSSRPGRPRTAARTTRRKVSTKASAKPKKKKVAAKPKKRVLSEKQKLAAVKKKEREELKELKDTALMKTEPKKRPDSAYRLFVTENAAKGVNAAQHMKETAAKFKELSAGELEQYNHIANQNKATNETAYSDWVEQHTAEQIRLANAARATLRRKMTNGKKTKRFGHGFSPIKDDRQVKRPTNAFFKFNTERQSSGDLKNIKLSEAVRLVKTEWDALPAGEKKKYQDLAMADKQRYAREFNTIYGHPPPIARINGARATA